MSSGSVRSPRFCGQCGAELLPGRFCIECGHPIRDSGALDAAEPFVQPVIASTGPTVRLGNAAGEQAVVGGTTKLPSEHAVPPGLWFASEPPQAHDIVAIYAPLRAIVGGWSGISQGSGGWRKVDQSWAGDESRRDLVSFVIEREWFPAPGYGGGYRLRVRIGASSFAEEGRTRHGFRYRIGMDPPMEVLDAWWVDARGRREPLAVPEIQLMAPPRVQRISDYSEPILRLNPRDADLWAKAGVVSGLYRLPSAIQQRTNVGRGLTLHEVIGGAIGALLAGGEEPLYRVQLQHPLIVRSGEWPQLLARMQTDGSELGLDMATDAVVEWWLERQGHDGALFERGAHSHGWRRLAIVFRRAQIAEITNGER